MGSFGHLERLWLLLSHRLALQHPSPIGKNQSAEQLHKLFGGNTIGLAAGYTACRNFDLGFYVIGLDLLGLGEFF